VGKGKEKGRSLARGAKGGIRGWKGRIAAVSGEVDKGRTLAFCSACLGGKKKEKGNFILRTLGVGEKKGRVPLIPAWRREGEGGRVTSPR